MPDNLNVTLTQDLYIKSRHDEVQVLFKIADPAARVVQAQALAAKGFIICNEIDALGGSAPLVMFMYAQMGLTWFPSMLQPPLVVAGGIEQQISKIDVNNPPKGSILVSVDANAPQYAPFDAVVTPPPMPLVGYAYGDGTYAPTAAALEAEMQGQLYNGKVISENGKQWEYHILAGGFLNRRWFTEVA